MLGAQVAQINPKDFSGGSTDFVIMSSLGLI